MRIISVLLLLLLSGCGYHTPGASDTWVGGEARTLYVQLFDNQTIEPYLENYITDALIAELAVSRLFELTENPDKADVRLVGNVKDFTESATSYGKTDQITEYSATMAIAVRLLDKNSSDIIWQKSLTRSEDYLATINKNLQLEGQRLAAIRVSQRLAEDIYASMLNSF
jgi:outer membrane lipopolysaccharide assembly protein LptE/RlpB